MILIKHIKYTVSILFVIFITGVSAYSQSLFIHMISDGSTYVKYGLKDSSGNVIVEPIYNGLYFNQEGRFYETQLENKFGIIDSNGFVVSEPVYDGIVRYSEGLFIVCANYHCGAIDEKGKERIPFIYVNIYEFKNGCAVAKKRNKDNEIVAGTINSDGKIVFPFIYSSMELFGEDKLAVVCDRSETRHYKCGCINKRGKIIIPLQYDRIELYQNNNIAIVTNNNQAGLINLKGKVIVPLKYNYIQGFSDGMAVVCKDGKSGYINFKGEEVIPLKYTDAQAFSEGFAAVKYNKWGYINKKGTPITEFKYSNVPIPFTNGVGRVSEGETIYIFPDGTEVRRKQLGKTLINLFLSGF